MRTLVIEVLSLVYQETSDERYVPAARKALQTFFIPVSQGGVTIKDTDEHWWYEEYADPRGVESRVLNVRNFVWKRPLPFFILLSALNVVGTAVSLAGIGWAGEPLVCRLAIVRPRGKTPAIAATRP